MKKNPQGKWWRRLDNTGKIFPLIANENLSNVFRITATLKEDVRPELLQRALEDVLPHFEGFQVKLKRGFFWYYFESNKRTPLIEQESGYPCRYIDPKSSQLFLFRVSYYKHRIHFEVFHAVTDGMGAVLFIRALVTRYLQLKRGDEQELKPMPEENAVEPEDSYLKNYRKLPKKRYSSERAVQLGGKELELGAENVIHGKVKVPELKAVCKRYGVSITKYLAACLIWSIYEEYLDGQPCDRHIGVNLPINLRAFFGSRTMSNFFAVTAIDFKPDEAHMAFERILELVSGQMDDKIVKEKLEETISYNVSNEKKWYVRIIPLCVKWAALGFIFRRNDRAHTITLSNIGPISVDEEYRDEVEGFHLIIGVSKQQPVKCGICSYGEDMVISFTTVFADARLQRRFFGKLEADGVKAQFESNGIAMPEADQKNYPEIGYDISKWKKLVWIFYAVLAAAAVIVGVVNLATYSGLWWSVIAIFGIAYAGLTMRYSILRHANLGKSLMIETLGMAVLLLVTDHVLGYQGWSVNYGIPSIILFADIAIVFLILVNRMNWQSYFMYQIAITLFSFIPIALWAAGFITQPVMAIITVILSVLILTMTVLLGDRRVKNELIRRFHL